jgi:monoamine oxidase
LQALRGHARAVRPGQLQHLSPTDALNGKPQRYRHDFTGYVAELLAKATNKNKLDHAVTAEDKEMLLVALRAWGALDENYTYRAGTSASDRRGYLGDAGGGVDAAPIPSTPLGLSDVLKSQLWRGLLADRYYRLLATMFQPVGGMDMIADAFRREVGDLIRFHAKITRVELTLSRMQSGPRGVDGGGQAPGLPEG